jgi:hypothetical protein
MIPVELPTLLNSSVPAVYCVGLLLGFDSLMYWRNGAESKRPSRQADGALEQTRALLSAASGGIRVSVAGSAQALEEANRLIERRYAWRGYAIGKVEGADRADHEAQSQEITLLARDGDTALGTLTVRLDGPLGLQADRSYAEAIAAARSEGRRVCELTRLAIAEAAESRTVLASLVSLAYAVGRSMHEVTDVFIEVNPRHVGFYQRALGFAVAAGERFCERVKAPSVLLRLEVAELERRVRALVATDDAAQDWPLVPQAA